MGGGEGSLRGGGGNPFPTASRASLTHLPLFLGFFLLSLFSSFFPEQTSSRPPSLLCFLEWTEGEKGQKRGKGNVNCEAQGREEKGRAEAAGQTHRKMLERNKSARSRAANWPQIAPEAAAKGRVSLSSLVGLCGIAFLWERRMQFFPTPPPPDYRKGERRGEEIAHSPANFHC